MVKLVFFCWRRPDISHQRYAEQLLEQHVPIALQHHPTLRRYTVNIVENTPRHVLELDSVGELFFDTLADFRERLYDSPAGAQIVEADVQRFMGGAHAYATTEHVQRAGDVQSAVGVRTPGLKLICPIRRRVGLTHAEFVTHWLERHVRLALQHHPGLTRYVTNIVDQRLSRQGAELDGVAELYFGSSTSSLFDSAADEQIIRADMSRFIAETCAYRVAEYVQKR